MCVSESLVGIFKFFQRQLIGSVVVLCQNEQDPK